MRSKIKAISVRLTEEELSQLDEMAKLLNMSRSEWVALKIGIEWDSLRGNPKIKAFLEEMKRVGESARKIFEPEKDVPDCDGLNIETAPHPETEDKPEE